jgi:hypothetical protein
MPEQVKTLVDKMPAPDGRGILSEIDREATLKAIAELHFGGDASVRAIVDMLAEPGKAEDHKARYALHALALYVCGGGRERNEGDRKAFAASLAKTLGDDRPAAVKEFVIREMQVCGGAEVVESIGRLLGESALAEAASAALVAIGGEAAVAQFRRMLESAKDAQRLIAVQSLGVLRDKQSVKALAAATTDNNLDVRAAAVWALANIGDPSGIDPCLKAAENAAGYERIQAGKSRLLLAERLRDAGRKSDAQRVYGHVQKTSADESEAYLRDIAQRELANLG